MHFIKRFLAVLLAGAAMLVASVPAHAVSVYDTLTAAVTFAEAQTAVLTVMAAVVSFSIVVTGAVLIWKFSKRARGA